MLCPQAYDEVTKMGIDAALDDRSEVSVAEYEEIEKRRESCIEKDTYAPDFSLPAGWFEEHYLGKKKLVLRQIKDFYRKR